MPNEKLNFDLDFLDNKKTSDQKKIEYKPTDKNNTNTPKLANKSRSKYNLIWIPFAVLFFISYISVVTSTPDKCKSISITNDTNFAYDSCITNEKGTAYWNILISYGVLFAGIFLYGRHRNKSRG